MEKTLKSLSFMPLPQGESLRLLQDRESILVPLAEEQARKLATPCPECGGSCRPTPNSDPRKTFLNFLPRLDLICAECGCRFDPTTGVIMAIGSATQVGKNGVPHE